MTEKTNEAEQRLIDAAKKARDNAHAPYSKFKVGAAILTGDGNIYAGCNVENASYGGSVCAERNAVAQAVASGGKDFAMLAIITQSDPPAAPCGLCRQVLVEFCDDLPILLCNLKGDLIRTDLKDLQPLPFRKF
jgi:cytidine deaminase